MNKYFYDDKAGVVIAVDDAGARVLSEIGGIAAGGGAEPIKGKAGRKAKVKVEKEETSAEPAAPRGKLSEVQKGQLEAELIADLPVAEIAGRFEVSTAYVYMVRMRLKKEGKL